MSALGQMASGIAHETNTPLDAIMLNARLLNKKNNEKAEPDPEVQKRADVIMNIGLRIAKIIKGLKNFSRNSSGSDWQDIDLGKMVDETLDLCHERCKQHGVELLIDRPMRPLQIRGDSVQASQVLLNLINNAFDAIQTLDQKWIRISWLERENYAEISVMDSGLGIPKTVYENMFNPFYTTKGLGNGMGLGLSISMGIMKQHRGELSYDKTSDHTRFVMSFPKLSS